MAATVGRSKQHCTINLPPSPPKPPVNKEAYPAGTCEACQTITLDALLATDERSQEENKWFSIRYIRDKDAAETCPLCRLVFSSIARGYEIEGFVEVKMSVDDQISGNDMYEAREVREVLIRKCWGTNAYVAGGGGFRVYADEGTATTLDSYCFCFVF
jgi:hypothetical protein